MNLYSYVSKFGKDADPEEVVKAIMADDDKVIGAFVAVAVAAVIGQIRHHNRARVKKAPVPKPGPVIRLSKRTMSRMKADVTGVLASWTIGGVALGLLTKTQLMTEAQRDREKGDGLFLNVAFYEALGQKMTSDQAVRDVWTVDQVEALRASIWKAEKAEVAA